MGTPLLRLASCGWSDGGVCGLTGAAKLAVTVELCVQAVLNQVVDQHSKASDSQLKTGTSRSSHRLDTLNLQARRVRSAIFCSYNSWNVLLQRSELLHARAPQHAACIVYEITIPRGCPNGHDAGIQVQTGEPGSCC
jgi:hypothetical protein